VQVLRLLSAPPAGWRAGSGDVNTLW